MIGIPLQCNTNLYICKTLLLRILSGIDKINKDYLPKHLAIIMDGNGRYKTKGMLCYWS